MFFQPNELWCMCLCVYFFFHWLNFCHLINYPPNTSVFPQSKSRVWRTQSELRSCRIKRFPVWETTWVAELLPPRPRPRRLWVAFWVWGRSSVPREPRAFSESSTWSLRIWCRRHHWLTDSWTLCPTESAAWVRPTPRHVQAFFPPEEHAHKSRRETLLTGAEQREQNEMLSALQDNQSTTSFHSNELQTKCFSPV